MGHVLFPFAGWQHDHAQTPLPCETSMTRARRPWAGGWWEWWEEQVCCFVVSRSARHASLRCCKTSFLQCTIYWHHWTVLLVSRPLCK